MLEDVHGKCAVAPNSLFELAPQSGTSSHRFKVCHHRPHTDVTVRQRAFSIRCVGPWNSLPDQVVSETNYKTFKTLLADALGDTLRLSTLDLYLVGIYFCFGERHVRFVLGKPEINLRLVLYVS